MLPVLLQPGHCFPPTGKLVEQVEEFTLKNSVGCSATAVSAVLSQQRRMAKVPLAFTCEHIKKNQKKQTPKAKPKINKQTRKKNKNKNKMKMKMKIKLRSSRKERD